MRGTLRDQFRDKHPFFWVVVFAAVWSLCHWGFSGAMLYKYGGQGKAGFEVDEQFRIYLVAPNGPAVGKLQPGDQIRAVNGVPVTEKNSFQPVYSEPVGTSYTLEIERAGSRQQVELTLRLHASPDQWGTWQFPIFYVLLGLSFLFVGLLVGFLQPADRTARLLFATFIIWSLSVPVTDRIFSLLNPIELQTKRFFQLFVVIGFTGAMLFHLFLRFPPGLPVNKFLERLKWVFYVVAFTEHALFLVYLAGITRIPRAITNILFAVLALTAPAIVLVVIRGYRLTREAQQRHRIKWVTNSVILAMSVFLLELILVWGVWPRLNPQPGTVTMTVSILTLYVTFALMLSMPVAWAYAILKHRVLDINVVIRRSLRYLLASRGFILIEALLAFALLSFVFAGRLGAWLDRFGSNTRTLITILGTVLMVLGLQTVNRKIRPLIDRRFFRDAYDAQQILTELTSSLRATTNVNQVLELTTAKIQQALYAANVTIFLRNGQHDFRSAVSRDYHEREKLSQSVTRELHLPDEAFVVQRVNDLAQPAEIDWDDPYSPVATQLVAMANGDASAQQEFDTLRALQTNLVLPLAAKDELLGVLALGPRAGDLPYSREDKRMLMNVAGQTAMALENSRLIEQKIDLEAENERRAQELEEARQLQLSMLPKRLPQLPHLDIAAYMKTASEVGGDYYDFHTSEDGTLTIAVGDATGHGLRAGTLVASVKSLFVSLAYHPDIAHIFTRMSRVLKEMKLRGLFMAMTMVKVNGQQLSVSIAGMPSVLIYRAASSTVEEVTMRALPLGGVTKYQYQQQELSLAANDVVVLMSDGLPERFNAHGEMLDYERIQQALPALAAQSSDAIIADLVRLGEEWSAGRVQDDDITFVVLKLKANTQQENL